MAYTYKGTRITGTSTTAKIFKNSGVKKAKVGDTYFNTETGHVYKCTTAGAPEKAKWEYKRTDIADKPSLTVKGLGSPKRTTVGSNSHYMKAEWKVPENLTNEKKGDRAQGLYIYWWLGMSGKDPKEILKKTNESLTSNQINLNNLTIGSKTYTRSSFYPLTKKKLHYVTAGVQPYNSAGKGKTVKEKRAFKLPKAPKIGAFSFNNENGEVSCTISTNEGDGYHERYDTRCVVTVENTRTKTKTIAVNRTETSTSFTVRCDVRDYQQLNYTQYVKVTVKAWARGYKGNSETSVDTFYVSYPAQATIQDISVSSAQSSGKCTVKLKTNSTAQHPVDRVKLEYLANVEYSKASQIPGDAAWSTTDILDDAQCNALALGVSELIPDRGNHTWIRLKTYHANETVLYRYSAYKEVTDLFTPAATAANERVKILSLTPGEDGQSLDVRLGWNASGTDDATGTELTWAEDENAWKSTKLPEDFEFEWSDGPYTSGGVTYQDSAYITIKGLDEGTKYYVKARRYLDGDPTTYSPYSSTATCITSEIPSAVVATCETYVPSGDSLQLYWTFSGNGIQQAWRVVTEDGTILASGEGSAGTAQIGASRLISFATNNELSFHVEVSTGSEYVASEVHTIVIVDPPTLTLTASDTLTVQPLSFAVNVSTLSDLVVIVTSQGASGQYPIGVLRQTVGDTIYSDVVSPTYTEGTEGWDATITLPTGLDFWDLGNYSLSVVAVDRATGLKSEEAEHSFGIAWTHQAPDPFEAITITPVDVVEDNGVHHQAADITLTAPAGSVSTDVYDIYRYTGDGAQLIGEGFPLSYVVRDEYAPFGAAMTQIYRIAIRTEDGDVAFADIEYVAEGTAMRFDWAGGSLELPYNISIADSYAKDVEFRKHLNGDTDGYWNQNIERKASLSSDVIRLRQQEDIIKARQLARYTGPVFVRTPDGSAYEADVQVSDMSTEGALTAIAIDATEIALTDEFRLPTPFEEQEETP